MPGRKIQENASADSTKEAPGRDVILRTDQFAKKFGQTAKFQHLARLIRISNFHSLIFPIIIHAFPFRRARSPNIFVYFFQLYASLLFVPPTVFRFHLPFFVPPNVFRRIPSNPGRFLVAHTVYSFRSNWIVIIKDGRRQHDPDRCCVYADYERLRCRNCSGYVFINE